MFTLEVTGLDNVIAQLDAFIEGVHDCSPAFDDMSNVIIQEFTANYEAEGEVLESPWEPRKRFYPWPLENKTGFMMENYQSVTEPMQLTISNPTEYATYQHFGTANLPPRKLIGSSDNILQIISDRLEAYLKELLYT